MSDILYALLSEQVKGRLIFDSDRLIFAMPSLIPACRLCSVGSKVSTFGTYCDSRLHFLPFVKSEKLECVTREDMDAVRHKRKY